MKIILVCFSTFLSAECIGQDETSGAQSSVWPSWISQYQRGSSESPTILVTETGDVYLTGRDTDLDYITIKYGSDGRPQWSANYDGPDGYPIQLRHSK